MALSEIIINDVVLIHTNAAISESNYHILRRYLLERRPLERVTNNINLLLSEHCNSDKQTAINYFTQLACDAQKNNDIQDAMSDELEENSDEALKSHYNSELHVLERLLTHLDMKSFYQQNNYNLLNSQLQEHKINLEQVNGAIDRIHNERQLLNARYALTQDVNELNNAPIHATPPASYTVQDQLTWDRLFHEENRLVAERQRLIFTISSKERDCTKEDQNLNKLLKEKKQTEKHYSEIKHQLDIDLPNREQQRMIRLNERHGRENARQSYDPNLQQLAYKNIEILKEQIANKNHELESKKNQLMDAAVEASYPVYIAQLELAFDQVDGLKINFKEHEALKSILEMMKNYTDMEEKERIIFQSVNLEKNNLHKLQKNLADSNAQLLGYIAAEPKLVQVNKDLIEENAQLKIKVDSADTIKMKALYTALFGVSGALISSGLINTLLISPLLLTIPSALVLLTFVSLTVALVYHWKKSSGEEQILQNKQTIAENETTIQQQWRKANELSVTTIPSLNAQIDKSEKIIVMLEKELKTQQDSMDQLFRKAQKVTNTYNASNTFFGGTEEKTGHYPDQPTTPIYEQQDNYTNYNDQVYH